MILKFIRFNLENSTIEAQWFADVTDALILFYVGVLVFNWRSMPK